MTDKNTITKSFNAANTSYDDYCDIQQIIGKNLLQLLTLHHHPSERIIDLGCGTGIVTQQLAKTINYIDFHAIDRAEHLLSKAKTRLTPLNIKTYMADFDDPSTYTYPFDLIFSNMALHWSSCLISAFSNIANLAKPGSLLAFSLPLPGTFKELQSCYSYNCFFEDTFINEILTCCGYDIIISTREKYILSFDDTFSALRSIKKTGANHVIERKHRGLRGKSFIKDAMIHQLTYQIGYFIATKRNIHASEIIRHRNRYRCRENLR